MPNSSSTGRGLVPAYIRRIPYMIRPSVFTSELFKLLEVVVYLGPDSYRKGGCRAILLSPRSLQTSVTTAQLRHTVKVMVWQQVLLRL